MGTGSKDDGEVESTFSARNEPLREGELVPVVLQGTLDPVYEGKAQVLNTAIQEIGMGWYQWQLFVVVGGFGWASDNLWPIVTSLILTPVANEFSQTRPPLLSLAQNIGLLVGAIFWGFGCMMSRRIPLTATDSFQLTSSAAGWPSI